MIYYHGTDVRFSEFGLEYSGCYKDFGRGIYLSEKKAHAISVALWRDGNHAYVYTYKVNLSDIRNKFKVLEFKQVSTEFLKFIITNRTSIVSYDYDIIVGATADASAQRIVSKFIKQFPYPTNTDYDNLKKMLNFDKYPTQICLKTQAIIDYFDSNRVEEMIIK